MHDVIRLNDREIRLIQEIHEIYQYGSAKELEDIIYSHNMKKLFQLLRLDRRSLNG